VDRGCLVILSHHSRSSTSVQDGCRNPLYNFVEAGSLEELRFCFGEQQSVPGKKSSVSVLRALSVYLDRWRWTSRRKRGYIAATRLHAAWLLVAKEIYSSSRVVHLSKHFSGHSRPSARLSTCRTRRQRLEQSRCSVGFCLTSESSFETGSSVTSASSRMTSALPSLEISSLETGFSPSLTGLLLRLISRTRGVKSSSYWKVCQRGPFRMVRGQEG
jgi:hypothetical protein